MSECTAGGEHEFGETEEDQWDSNSQMTRPTGCSKCGKVWDYWQYNWDGEWEYENAGNPECIHEWHDTNGSDHDGPDGAPYYIEECGKCDAKREMSFRLTEQYHGDAEGNRV